MVAEEGEVIDKVVDHDDVEGEDVYAGRRVIIRKFLVKWKGKANIHNSWETYDILREFKGIKKVDNYVKNIDYERTWKESASPEEIESVEVAREMQRFVLIAPCLCYTRLLRTYFSANNPSTT
jgi:chromodomain-helicase-DNA-binding protein 1